MAINATAIPRVAPFDATVPTTAASGDAAAVGSATSAPHRDHLHGMPVILSNLIEDLTPQLGGNLDGDGNNINNLLLLAIQTAVADVMNVATTFGGVGGVTVNNFHQSASPGNADEPFTERVNAFDSTGVNRLVHVYRVLFDDVLVTSMDSSLAFNVMDNVNAAGANTIATLTSMGVWTDASAEAAKAFEGDSLAVWGGIPGQVVTDKLKALLVQRYHSANSPAGKEIKERHVSPTAEDFYLAFGCGHDPANPLVNKDGVVARTPGLAAKDIGAVALLAIQELTARLEVLEAAP